MTYNPIIFEENGTWYSALGKVEGTAVRILPTDKRLEAVAKVVSAPKAFFISREALTKESTALNLEESLTRVTTEVGTQDRKNALNQWEEIKTNYVAPETSSYWDQVKAEAGERAEGRLRTYDNLM